MKIEQTKIESPKTEFTSFAEISISAYAKDEPIAYRIVRSGWSKPAKFHVLIEFGDYDDTTYKGLMTSEQIKDELGFIVIEDTNIKSYTVKHPNDMEFGKAIRTVANNLTQSVKI
jgi:hypothetical protein